MGTRLVPLLVAAGHEVTATTRTPSKVDLVQRLGAIAVVCDVLDADAIVAAVTAARPDAIVHQLTDLPDDPADIPRTRDAHARIREDGTDNLLAAAAAVGVTRVVVQSIAWMIDGAIPPSVVHLERRTRAAGGVVLRYGQWYGPGTYHQGSPPPEPCVHIDAAAQATLDALDLAPGTYVVTDDGTSHVDDVDQ